MLERKIYDTAWQDSDFDRGEISRQYEIEIHGKHDTKLRCEKGNPAICQSWYYVQWSGGILSAVYGDVFLKIATVQVEKLIVIVSNKTYCWRVLHDKLYEKVETFLWRLTD